MIGRFLHGTLSLWDIFSMRDTFSVKLLSQWGLLHFKEFFTPWVTYATPCKLGAFTLVEQKMTPGYAQNTVELNKVWPTKTTAKRMAHFVHY